MLRSCLAVLAAALVLTPAASATVPSQRDGSAIAALAHAHWPSGLCSARYDAVLVTHAARPAAARRPCTLVLNTGARLSAAGWCEAMRGALATLAAGTKPSSIPYRCSLVVGPPPRRADLATPPGLSRPDALAAFAVADAHWPHSPCRGHEQVVIAPGAFLIGSSADAPIDGSTIMGMAELRDTHCVAFLNGDVGWTQTTLCITAEHEYGHLLGLGHSSDPGSVMSPVNSRSEDCESRFGALPSEIGGDVPTPVGSPGGFGGLG